MKPWFYLQTLAAIAPATGAASIIDIGGYFECNTSTLICAGSYSFPFDAVVGMEAAR